MEGDFHWHHGHTTNEQFLEAMAALGEEVSPEPDSSLGSGTTPLPEWAVQLAGAGV